MRFLGLILIAMTLSACSTTKPKGYELPPVVREVFRGGELKGLENVSGEDPRLYPSQHDLVQQVCVSQPIFGLYGEYIRTAVRCW